MAENDDKPQDVNLELPSFGLRRKRKEKNETDPVDETTPADEAGPAPDPTRDVAPAAPVAPAPLVTPPAETTRFAPPAAPAPAPAPAAAAPADPAPAPAPVAPTAPVPPAPPVTPAAPQAPAPAPVTPHAPLAPSATPAAVTPTAPRPASLAPDLADAPEDEPTTLRGPRFQAPKMPELPRISGAMAAVVTGLIIGLLACGATWVSLQGCEAIRGTSSCGGPGFLLLLAILIVLVLAGSALLSLLRVPEAASTSFLAVGLLAMLVLLVLTSWIFQWWMVLVIPPLAAGTYSLAHWVTAHAGED